jgi:DNA-directed RNA polymerase sigma subunit (sigma70/sigma32)
LSECSERERRVFQAMYGGLCKGAEEVARQTGLSVQRVRQIHCEVRKKLRESLQGASGE